LPYFDRLDVDVIAFEAADNGGDELESFAKGIGPGKKIAIGVISLRTLQVERPEEVANLIRRALKVIPPERLIVSTRLRLWRPRHEPTARLSINWWR